MKDTEFIEQLAADLDLEPTDERIKRFASEFKDGCASGWESLLPSKDHPYKPTLQGPVHLAQDLNELERVGLDFTMQTERLASASLQYAVDFKERLDLITKFLAVVAHQEHDLSAVSTSISQNLNVLIHELVKMTGDTVRKRGPKPKLERSFATAGICVMADCIFDTNVYATNEETPLTRLLRTCYQYANLGNQQETKAYIVKCFSDIDLIRFTELAYQKYRLPDKLLRYREKVAGAHSTTISG